MEIEQLVKKAKANDESAMSELMIRFRPLILKMANNIYIKDYDRDDLIQLGYVAIIKAVTCYNPERNTNFTAYVSNAIRKNYYYEIRKSSKRNYDTSFDKLLDERKEAFEIENFNGRNFENPIEDRIIKKEQMDELKKILKTLTKEERDLLLYAYNKDVGGIREYSKITGIKYGTLQKRKRALLYRIRKIYIKWP